MKGDFSKLRFDAKKHYHDVLMQQGRVMLDSDWNEQGAIEAYRTETGTLDIIGNSGAPMHNAGFGLQPSDNSGNTSAGANKTNLRISTGHMYVDGILCENEANIVFADQPDYAKTALPTATGTYMFYLDVWQRHVSVLEDTSIREVALGGPDTTTRSKTIWQVKYAEMKGITAGVNCLTNLPADILPLSTGLLSARPEEATVATDPCGLTASGGYRRLENQLYRVEVHTGGATRAASKFKWSRDNGSVAVKWESVDSANANKLMVSSTGRDELLGFKSGNWIELIDDTTDLLGKPGVMVQLSKVEGNVLTINVTTIKDPNNAAATAVARSTNNPRIRRWDSDGILPMNNTNAVWAKLEDGIEVKFAEGIYKTGDYWLIPARTATANVEWPKDSANVPVPLPPHGVQHHFCKLAIVEVDSTGQWTLKSDCRHVFPPVTELTNLYYAGGDGQEAMPGKKLPATLKVGVANGQWAVAGAKIKYEVVSGGGSLNNTLATTNSQGIADCEWTLGTNTSDLKLQVKASLLDAANNVMQQQLPVIFNASFSIAENVAYTPKCTNWTGSTPPDTVAKALDQLCERKSETSTGCSYTIGPQGDFRTLWEAIQRLHKSKEDYVSLCYMPGNHVIDENIMMAEMKISFKILKITGYSAVIDMKAEKIDLVADKLILQGLNLISNPEGTNNGGPGTNTGDIEINPTEIKDINQSVNTIAALFNNPQLFQELNLTLNPEDINSNNGGSGINTGNIRIDPTQIKDINPSINAAAAVSNDAQIRLIAGEIIMDYCNWNRIGTGSLAFISIIKEGLVYLTNNKIYPILSLANGVQGVIEKNIVYLVLLQNDDHLQPFTYKPLWNNAQEKKEIYNRVMRGINPESQPEQKVNLTGWSLTIRSNRVGVIVTNTFAQRASPPDIYQDLFITENIFALFFNSFVGQLVNMVNNQFLFSSQNLSLPLSYVLGFNIVIIGNISAAAKTIEGSLVSSIIDVIKINSVRGDGVGAAQLFNLVNVVI